MTRYRTWVLIGIGWLFVALGLIGVILPVMPTTPFLLVALWAFARSSPRFHAWLWNHRWFGPYLRDWEQRRVIPLHAKLMSVGAMSVSLVYVIGFSPAPWYAGLVMAGVCAYGAWFILTKPSR